MLPPSDSTTDAPPAAAPFREPQRLHPAVVGVWAIGAIGPAALLSVTGTVARTFAVATIALAAGGGLVRWLRFRWRVDAQALVVEQGLLQQQRRTIPLERIQSVELVRTLRHRLFGVVEVRVETVGGGATEGKLDALRPSQAQALRDVLLRRTPADDGAAAPEQETEVLVALRPGRLVVAGVTGGRVGIAAAVFGFAQNTIGDRLFDFLPQLSDVTQDVGALLTWGAVVAVGGFTLSVLATLVTYWGFELSSDGVALRVRRGLLDQRTDTIPLRRIQAARVEENLARRWLGLAALRVDVAGRTSAGDEAQVSGVLLPLGRRDEALRLVEVALSRTGLAAVTLEPMPDAARDRRLVRAGLVTLLAVAGALAALRPWGLAAVLVAVPATAAALASYRSLGRGVVGDVTVARSGWLVRRTAFVPRSSLQSLALQQSPLQRRRRLATLALQIPHSGRAEDPQLIDLDEGVAEGLLAALAATPLRQAT